jgi:hypothetical protein
MRRGGPKAAPCQSLDLQAERSVTRAVTSSSHAMTEFMRGVLPLLPSSPGADSALRQKVNPRHDLTLAVRQAKRTGSDGVSTSITSAYFNY